MVDLGEQIRQLRLSYGLTQKQLAHKTGISERGIQNYERNLRRPTYDVLLKIAKFFGTTVDYLISDEESLEEGSERGSEPIRLDELALGIRKILLEVGLIRDGVEISPDEQKRLLKYLRLQAEAYRQFND